MLLHQKKRKCQHIALFRNQIGSLLSFARRFARMLASIARFGRIPVVPAAAPIRSMASAAAASSAPFKILGIQQVAVGGLSKGEWCNYTVVRAEPG